MLYLTIILYLLTKRHQLPNNEKLMHFIKCVSLFTCYGNYDSQKHASTFEVVRACILPQDYSRKREKMRIFILENIAP